MKKNNFPTLTFAQRAALMEIPQEGKIPIVIDSDTFNEIDDQYAIAWAMLNKERLDLQAVYAAPFYNSMYDSNHFRVETAQKGMELSYDEIHRLMERMPNVEHPPVYKGSTRFLFEDPQNPEASDAALDLIKHAHQSEEVLQVLSIGAPTNIANALLIDPSIIKKIHIIWLGGHALNWPDTKEFNLMQDKPASRILLDLGAALTLIPCMGVANTLATSIPELETVFGGKNPLADFFAKEAGKCPWIGFGHRKVIWDIATIGYVLNPSWYRSQYQASPILNDNLTWSFDDTRHKIRIIDYIERDPLFVDLFTKILEYK